MSRSRRSAAFLACLRQIFDEGIYTEEKDIFDVNEAVKETYKADLLELYAYLKDGSSTHLRGFMAQIRAAGGDYAPQFISAAEFEKAMKATQ